LRLLKALAAKSEENMPGIVGIVQSGINPKGEARFVHDMIQALIHYPWYVWAQKNFSGASLGIVSLSASTGLPNCLMSGDGRCALVFEGELYNTEELREALYPNSQNDGAQQDHVSLVLHALVRWGAGALERFNGLFQLAFWDSRSQELILSGDPAGLRPLYLAHRDNKLAFAPEVKALLVLPWVSRAVDAEGVMSFVQKGFVRDERTFFENVKALPGGCFARFKRGRLEIQRYFHMPVAGHNRISASELQARFVETWQDVMRRQTAEAGSWGTLLNGGLASRLILAGLVAQGKMAPTFTTGQPDCQDSFIAKQVAEAAGCANLFSPIIPGEVTSGLERAVYMTDGMFNCFHANVRHALPSLAETVSVVFDDLCPLGGFYERRVSALLLRTVVEVRCPYFDKKMLELLSLMSPGHRSKDEPLHRHAIRQLAPELARLPWNRTGLPLTAGALQTTLRLGARRMRKKVNALRKICWGKVAPRAGAEETVSYDHLLRTSPELQRFVISRLFSGRPESPRFFGRETAHTLLTLHLNGKGNHADFIGRLLTVSLWHQLFVRQSSRSQVREISLAEAA
jgi:hypothetical protein